MRQHREISPGDPKNGLTKQALSPVVEIDTLPVLANANPRVVHRIAEYFCSNLSNDNSRSAYGRAVSRFFSWCSGRGFTLERIEPLAVAAYIEELKRTRSVPTVKQSLAAIRGLFDWLVSGGILASNPAASVRGPKHVVSRGKTPVLSPDQARSLLDSIDTRSIVGLRDRALIGVMVYSFARVSAVVGLRVEDYHQDGKRWWFRFREKGGKRHHLPAHHKAEQFLDVFLDAAGIRDDRTGPIFRTIDRRRHLTDRPMTRNDAFRMIQKRSRVLGLPPGTCCHTFRATGITAYLSNGGTIEKAQAMAGHASPRTTKLYDRTSDEVTLDEVERIVL